MSVETLKLGLIDRLMKVQEESTLRRMNELITQAELEAKAKESLKAIADGDVLSIEQFKEENQQWLKTNYSK